MPTPTVRLTVEILPEEHALITAVAYARRTSATYLIRQFIATLGRDGGQKEAKK